MTNTIDAQVAKLRDMLQTCDTFKDIGEAFYDLTDMDEFLDLGVRVESPLVTSLLQAGGEAIRGRTVPVETPLCIHVPLFQLYHGPCLVDGYDGTIFFFEDLGMGLVWIWKADTEETLFTRISTTMISGPAFLAHPEHPASD